MRGPAEQWYWFKDSYHHYRRHVGLPRYLAIYRAIYYRIRKKEPYT